MHCSQFNASFPFLDQKEKVSRTTERCHHTEYERVCPIKFWYYNNLITNQQNILIVNYVSVGYLRKTKISKKSCLTIFYAPLNLKIQTFFYRMSIVLSICYFGTLNSEFMHLFSHHLHYYGVVKCHLRSYEQGCISSYRQEFMFEMCFHETKRECMDFLL